MTPDGLVFTGDLAAGHAAYVETTAAPAGGDVEAFVVEIGGELDDPQLALGALVGSIRAVLAGADGTTEIMGDGVVASVLRRERRLPSEGERPAVVVDLTGDPATIRAATDRLADLGTLVLARNATAPVDLDLYPDVHVRGLRLVGVPGPDQSATPVPVSTEQGAPAPARLDVPVSSPAASWYRVTS